MRAGLIRLENLRRTVSREVGGKRVGVVVEEHQQGRNRDHPRPAADASADVMSLRPDAHSADALAGDPGRVFEVGRLVAIPGDEDLRGGQEITSSMP